MGKFKRAGGDKFQRVSPAPQHTDTGTTKVGGLYIHRVGKYTVETDVLEVYQAIRQMKTPSGVSRAMDRIMAQRRREGKTSMVNRRR